MYCKILHGKTIQRMQHSLKYMVVGVEDSYGFTLTIIYSLLSLYLVAT